MNPEPCCCAPDPAGGVPGPRAAGRGGRRGGGRPGLRLALVHRPPGRHHQLRARLPQLRHLHWCARQPGNPCAVLCTGAKELSASLRHGCQGQQRHTFSLGSTLRPSVCRLTLLAVCCRAAAQGTARPGSGRGVQVRVWCSLCAMAQKAALRALFCPIAVHTAIALRHSNRIPARLCIARSRCLPVAGCCAIPIS